MLCLAESEIYGVEGVKWLELNERMGFVISCASVCCFVSRCYYFSGISGFLGQMNDIICYTVLKCCFVPRYYSFAKPANESERSEFMVSCESPYWGSQLTMPVRTSVPRRISRTNHEMLISDSLFEKAMKN